jgi:glycosyltransferase involved in cell wall biosynthesis
LVGRLGGLRISDEGGGTSGIRILMIAPEPCFQARGTPFSVYHRIVALLRLGHHIDLATYPFGENIPLEGLCIFRSATIPGVTNVKVGPSRAKIVLDLLLLWRCVGLLLRNRYDAIHTHEEAGFWGAILAWLVHKPHIYDMHSDLAQQLSNFQFTRNRLLVGLMQWVQRFILRGSAIVIVICADLERCVSELAPGKRTVLIENTSVLSSYLEPEETEVDRLRHQLGLDGRRVALYTGTMEPYQGLGLWIESLKYVVGRHPEVTFLAVGGVPKQIAVLESLAASLGVRDHLILTGPRPSEEMWLYMRLADILVSPRSRGTNTPLKLYAYLRAGRPILATNLLTHTQVLDSDTAMLVEPTPQGLAEGTIRLLEDDALARRLAESGLRLAEARYSYEAFLNKTATVYSDLGLRPYEAKPCGAKPCGAGQGTPPT